MPKRIMVTGATGAIGRAIAMRLASDPQNSVILIGKNREKCEEAVINIRSKTRNPRVEYDLCDLSR
ncbi:MAG: SDR family NAD(P)-dependent oxidoreductase, partial [Spirochaetales bacterium]|nr:SDR family NAD(P)-dependent oxidoreductase [Spirochaetales bacterium]